MFANLSSSSRERKYATNNFTKNKKGGTEEMFNDLNNSKNVCLINVKQPFNMYNTTHSIMTKSSGPNAATSFNHNHSFNLSHNLGTMNQDKKSKKYSSSSSKHPKQAVYNSYTNMSKKKHPRASSNTDTAHMSIQKQDDYLSRSSKKTKNILFKLASELSHSPDKGKTRKVYTKDSKKKGYKDPAINNLYKSIPGFGAIGDCSGNRLNTEATDDASLNSGRNRVKSRPAAAVYNNINEVPTITLDGTKTPQTKGARTISNEFMDNYNKSRNEDAITCKRDCSK